jgi:hypothetical protein
MTRSRQAGTVVLAVAVLIGMAAFRPAQAEARGHGGFHGGGRVVVGGFVGPYLGFNYGWGPFWSPYWSSYAGPYAYGQRSGVDMNAAMIAGYGAIDLDVKPNRAEVWVDGKYVGEARDLDGDPSYLWLKEGTHRVTIAKGGFATIRTKVDVLRGIKRKVKVRLDQGAPQEAPRSEPGESS